VASTALIEYELDREDRISWVNEAWSEFARDNEAQHLVDSVIGTPIWRWVAGEEVRQLYQLLFSRVRNAGGTTRLPFRCDSPDLRRFMELDISSLPGDGLRCSAQLERVEPRRPLWFLDPGAPRSEELQWSEEVLGICSCCKRVRVDEELWLEPEEAASALRLLEDPPVAISHTICVDCAALFAEPIARMPMRRRRR